MNALILKGFLLTGLIGGVSGVSFWFGKTKAPAPSLQPCVLVIPNTPAFTYTEKEKREHAQFYRDFNQGPAGARNPKRWLVP